MTSKDELQGGNSVVDKTDIALEDEVDLRTMKKMEGTPEDINKKTKKEAYVFINNIEKILCKEAGKKGFSEFIDKLGAKFPVSLGEDFKKFSEEEKVVALEDMLGGKRAFDLYNQSTHYIINDKSISFFLKGGGADYHLLDLSFEGRPKVSKNKKLKIKTPDASEAPKISEREKNIDEKAIDEEVKNERNAENIEISEKRLAALENLRTSKEVYSKLREIAQNLPDKLLKDLSGPLSEVAEAYMSASIDEEGNIDVDRAGSDAFKKAGESAQKAIESELGDWENWSDKERESLKQIGNLFMID